VAVTWMGAEAICLTLQNGLATNGDIRTETFGLIWNWFFSPERTRHRGAGEDGTTREWDDRSPAQRTARVEGHERKSLSVAFRRGWPAHRTAIGRMGCRKVGDCDDDRPGHEVVHLTIATRGKQVRQYTPRRGLWCLGQEHGSRYCTGWGAANRQDLGLHGHHGANSRPTGVHGGWRPGRRVVGIADHPGRRDGGLWQIGLSRGGACRDSQGNIQGSV